MSEWQPIETAPLGMVILYFPEEMSARGDWKFYERIVIDIYPASYPRKPTHWMPIPEPPKR